MVSRPDVAGIARGLMLTLSNPVGVHFTPASAPIVLRRLGEYTPQLGFVHPGSPDYDLYQTELQSVVPDFGILVQPPLKTEAREGAAAPAGAAGLPKGAVVLPDGAAVLPDAAAGLPKRATAGPPDDRPV
jgi:hypothetical protein